MLTTNPRVDTTDYHVRSLTAASIMQDSGYKIIHEAGGTISGELAAQWAELARRIARPVFIHDINWFRAQLSSRHYVAQSCHIFSLSYEDQVIAIFPMQYTVTRRFGMPLRTWRIFWPNDMGINDFIIAAPFDAHNYLQLLMAKLNSQAKTYPWDLLELENVLDTSTIAEVINHYPLSRCISVYHHDSKYLNCASSYESSVVDIPRKLKSNNRRRRRKLEKMGTVTTSYCSSADELVVAFEQFLEVEAANWKGREGTALRCDAEQCSFYRALLDEYATTGRCVIHTLNLDDTPVAAQLALISGDTFNLLKIGYDAKYHAMSPGGLLLEETINLFSGDAQIRRISFVTGAKWNDDWAPHVDRVYNHYIYNATARGLFFWPVEKMKSALRRIKRKLVSRERRP
ncbi:MAG: GNAT family N-acetyltransferase [Gammaproteobacteria bacterium]|nr:GNAT family N-acetyltransferase [Gammaproteobacteria bacterium]